MCSRHDFEHLGSHVLAPATKAVAYTTLTAEDYVMADPIDAIRAGMTEAPYWAVIYPSGRVSFIHGRPTPADLNRAVGGYIEAVPHDAPEHLTAYCNEYGKIEGQDPNPTATAFLRVRHDVLAGRVVLIGGPDAAGEDEPLPAEVRMRLVREVIEA